MTIADTTTQLTLRESVKNSIISYFSKLEGNSTTNIYQLVLTEVEIPLLEIVMQQAQGNQSKAAKWLGISRNTLRKLLEKYNIV